MGHMRTVDVIILVVYFAAMAAIGPYLAYFAKRKKSTERYFVGNRSFSGWLVGLSMFATSISSITFVAYPADAFKTAYLRLLPAFMLPVGVFICSMIFLPFYRRARVTSAFEYLEGRFGPGVRLYAALAFILNQITRLSLILYLVAVLVHEMTGLNTLWCILIGGLVTSFYTATGGIEAVIWTDFIQSFLLWAGGFAIVIVLFMNIEGGLGRIISEAAADGKFMFGDLNPATGRLERAAWGFSLTQKTVLMMLLIGLTNWLFEYSSNQNVIQKYVATKNPKEATKAIWVCCACSIPTWAFFMFLGTCFYVYFKLHPAPAATAMLTGAGGAKPEGILPFFVINYLPAGLSGLVVAGILAAAMSSLSSSINAIAAVGVVDVYKRHIVREGSERHYYYAALGLSVFASACMLLGAFLLIVANTKTMLDTSTKIGALALAGLLGIYCLGFLTKRGDSRAVWVGIVCVICYSLWITAIEMKWITMDWLLARGISPDWAQFIVNPMDTYYSGLFGNLMMFFVAYFFGALVFRRKRDLKNLTIWDQDWKNEPQPVETPVSN